ncbi:hypothetical protein [Lutibacter sp.]
MIFYHHEGHEDNEGIEKQAYIFFAHSQIYSGTQNGEFIPLLRGINSEAKKTIITPIDIDGGKK